MVVFINCHVFLFLTVSIFVRSGFNSANIHKYYELQNSVAREMLSSMETAKTLEGYIDEHIPGNREHLFLTLAGIMLTIRTLSDASFYLKPYYDIFF